jgi:hypothetical protein
MVNGMNILVLLTGLSVLVGVIALIVLLVRAFETNILWGLAVLFLTPFLLHVFAFVHWERAKKPYLLLLASVLIALGSAVIQKNSVVDARTIASNAPSTQAEQRKETVIAAEIKSEATKNMNDIATRQNQNMVVAQRETIVVPQVVKQGDVLANAIVPEPKANPIPLDKVKDYIGSDVILVDTAGKEYGYRLIGVDGNILRFEKRFKSGVMSFSYKKSEIQSLKIYQR